MKILDKSTVFFFSVSNNPSKRGSNFYNNLFLKKKKNFIYVPLLIKNNFFFEKFLNFLKTGIIKVGGISVSMPLKSYAKKISNQQHRSVILSKNANTLIFKKKKYIPIIVIFLLQRKFLKIKNSIILLLLVLEV